MNSTLEELWHGNISPQENSRNNTPEMKQLMVRVYRATRNDYATVENCWSEYASLAEEAIFVYAFRLGAQMMLEILRKENEP